jgi:DNA-directed RNA polymerase subunit E'/Rpb7
MKKYLQKIQIWRINKTGLRIKMMNVRETVIMRKNKLDKEIKPEGFKTEERWFWQDLHLMLVNSRKDSVLAVDRRIRFRIVQNSKNCQTRNNQTSSEEIIYATIVLRDHIS